MEFLNAVTKMIMSRAKKFRDWARLRAWLLGLMVLTGFAACCILTTCWSIVATTK